MATNLVDALLDEAEDDLDDELREEPLGSNRGEELDEIVLLPYGRWMLGEPWCAAWRGSLLRRIGVDDWMSLASPSTATMCRMARERGMIVPPMPGAAIVRCGIHVETVVSQIAGSLWNTIGGNTSDRVKRMVRDVNDWDVCYLEPELLASWKANPGRAEGPAVEFYFHDTRPELVKQGGFPTAAKRDAWIAKLSADWQSRASRWRNAAGFGATIGPRVLYGPYRTQEKRNTARKRVAAVYRDDVKDYAPFRVERRPGGAVTVPAVPASIAKRLGLKPGTVVPDDLGKTT